MFETPRIVPHELVHDDSTHSGDTSREIDMCKYGEAYEPVVPRRVANSPMVDGHTNQMNDHDEDDKSYGSGGQGAGS